MLSFPSLFPSNISSPSFSSCTTHWKRQILQGCLKRLRLGAGFGVEQMDLAGCHVEREVGDDLSRDVT